MFGVYGDDRDVYDVYYLPLLEGLEGRIKDYTIILDLDFQKVPGSSYQLPGYRVPGYL